MEITSCAMKQKQYKPYSMAQEVISIYAGVNGRLDEVSLSKVALFEQKLQEKVANRYPEILQSVEQTRDLSDAVKTKLNQVLDLVVEEMAESADK